MKKLSKNEDGNELETNLAVIFNLATNMNDQKTVQFYQGINAKQLKFLKLNFFTNEINSSSDNDFEAFKNGSGKYKNWLIDLRRFKDHQLDQKGENLFR